MTKQLSSRQQRLLSDLEKCEKPVNALFEDYRMKPKVLGRWLSSPPFKAELRALRKRMNFRLEQELSRGAVVASARLFLSVMGATHCGKSGVIARPVEVQACASTIKMFIAVVRDPKLKKQTEAAIELARQTAGASRGYHASHSAQRAAALLARMRKEDERENRLDRDQDEDGTWMPCD